MSVQEHALILSLQAKVDRYNADIRKAMVDTATAQHGISKSFAQIVLDASRAASGVIVIDKTLTLLGKNKSLWSINEQLHGLSRQTGSLLSLAQVVNGVRTALVNVEEGSGLVEVTKQSSSATKGVSALGRAIRGLDTKTPLTTIGRKFDTIEGQVERATSSILVNTNAVTKGMNTLNSAIKSIDAKGTFVPFKNQIISISKQLQIAEKRVAALQKQLGITTKEVSKQDKSFIKLTGTIIKLKEQIGNLKLASKAAKIEFKELKKSIAGLDKTIRELQAEAKSAAKESSKMASDIERLVKSVEKLKGKTQRLNDELAEMKTRAQGATGAMGQLSQVAKGVSAGIAAKAFTEFSDSISIADSQLRNVTANTEQYVFVQQELNRIARESRQDVNELTSVYAKFSLAGQDAGFTQHQILGLTEKLTKAFKIEGNTTAEVNSTLTQLTQSFRSGVIAGEEFKSLSEASSLTLKALADQLGVTKGELKKLASSGGVKPEDLIKGLDNIDDLITEKFDNLAPTFWGVGTQLGNTFAMAFRDSEIQNITNFLLKKTNDAFARAQFLMSENGKRLEAQKDLMLKIGNDAVGSIKNIADEIAKVGKAVEAGASVEEIEAAAKKIKDLKKEISSKGGTLTVGDSERTRNQIIEVKQLIEEYAKLQIAESRNRINLSDDAPKKTKSIVSLDIKGQGVIGKGLDKLKAIKDRAAREAMLLQKVADKRLTQAEANATKAAERELDAFDQRHGALLEKTKISEKQITAIRDKAGKEGVAALTKNEKLILNAEAKFKESRTELERKHQDKITKIQIKAAEKRAKRFGKQSEKLKVQKIQAQAEINLTQKTENAKESKAEQRAQASHDKKMARFESNFAVFLERNDSSITEIESIEKLAQEKGESALTTNQQQLLDIRRDFNSAQASLVLAHENKILGIKTAAAAKEKAILTKEGRRLSFIKEQAALESELLAEVAAGRMSQDEADETIRQNAARERSENQFNNKLAAMGVQRETLDQLESDAHGSQLENLTERETDLLKIKHQFSEAEIALRKRQAIAIQKIRDKAAAKDKKTQAIAEQHKLSTQLSYGGRFLSVLSRLSKEGSAIQETTAKAAIVANTASAVIKSFNNAGGYPHGVIPASLMALEGLAAFSSVGSGSVGSGGGGGAPPEIPQEPEQETSRTEVSTTVLNEDGSSGTGQQNVVMSFDESGGTPTEQLFARAMNDGLKRGALSNKVVTR